MTEPLDPPPGCQEIAGFIVEFGRGGPWLTKDGQATTDWNMRGVWETKEQALQAVARSATGHTGRN